MNKRAFTLIEILVASVLLASIIFGMTNLFVSGKRYILHISSRMTSGELGKFFLDPLQTQVRQDTWATNCLGTANAANCTPPLPTSLGIADGLDRNYAARYDVAGDSPMPNVNRVIIVINWTETAP